LVGAALFWRRIVPRSRAGRPRRVVRSTNTSLRRPWEARTAPFQACGAVRNAAKWRCRCAAGGRTRPTGLHTSRQWRCAARPVAADLVMSQPRRRASRISSLVKRISSDLLRDTRREERETRRHGDFDQGRDAIRTRHYSYRAEVAYVGWIPLTLTLSKGSSSSMASGTRRKWASQRSSNS
jgi:hypothetical protein